MKKRSTLIEHLKKMDTFSNYNQLKWRNVYRQQIPQIQGKKQNKTLLHKTLGPKVDLKCVSTSW
jgi:hypothetical protein